LHANKNQLHSTPATWIVLIALGALFFLFTFGMFMTTFYQLAVNRTTVEEMSKHEVHNIALLGRSPAPSTTSSNQSNILCEVQRTPSRSYIVLQTQPGDNPWDVHWKVNIQSIMGNSVLDWFNPLKISPCLTRNDPEGEFAWGPAVRNLMEEYGAGSAYGRSQRKHRRRRSRSVSVPN
jgi:palmitoyltransferase